MPDTFDGSWSEMAMPPFATTQVAFASAVPLIMNVDEGVVDSTAMGSAGTPYFHWTDAGGGTLASWLQSQRGGNSVVTLALVPSPAPAITSITFDDRENSFGCPRGGNPPTLQISGDGDPLAITLSNFDASSSNLTMLWVGLVVLLVAVVSLLVYRRVRQS